jgi:hypothetical protein
MRLSHSRGSPNHDLENQKTPIIITSLIGPAVVLKLRLKRW